MDIRAALSFLRLFSLVDTALFSECWCVWWFCPFMSVSAFVFFNISKRFFFHLALALPQVFNFSVLCLAVNAFICFDIGGFFSSCWSSVQLFCFAYNFLYIHQCNEVIVM